MISEIEQLQATIDAAARHRDNLVEAEHLAQAAVNVVLRQFTQDPSESNQKAVDKAEQRAADARKRLFTSDNATRLARADLLELEQQARIEHQAAFEAKVKAHSDRLADDTDATIEALRPLLLRLVEITHFVDGIDVGWQDMGKMLDRRVFDRSMKGEIVEHVNSITKGLRDESL